MTGKLDRRQWGHFREVVVNGYDQNTLYKYIKLAENILKFLKEKP